MLPLTPAAVVDDAELYGAVSQALWRQRARLEALRARLIGVRAILGSGPDGWLTWADRDVRRALNDLRYGEVARAVQVEALIRRRGLEPDLTLAELADGAPGMWGDVLRGHLVALRTLAIDVRDTAGANRRVLQLALNGLDPLAGAPVRAALQTTAALRQLSLLTFLS
jgi:hypothetical protein